MLKKAERERKSPNNPNQNDNYNHKTLFTFKKTFNKNEQVKLQNQLLEIEKSKIALNK